jgi:hypothetical protein
MATKFEAMSELAFTRTWTLPAGPAPRSSASGSLKLAGLTAWQLHCRAVLDRERL